MPGHKTTRSKKYPDHKESKAEEVKTFLMSRKSAQLISNSFCYSFVCGMNPEWPKDIDDSKRIKIIEISNATSEYIPSTPVNTVKISANPGRYIPVLSKLLELYEKEHDSILSQLMVALLMLFYIKKTTKDELFFNEDYGFELDDLKGIIGPVNNPFDVFGLDPGRVQVFQATFDDLRRISTKEYYNLTGYTDRSGKLYK
ncbi:hypothetical protein HPULCUR_010827 [Helicostylum pulchrum]|uniref:Uncharacterized protein n=1 Tax=Helicostylum pulchrum TaxID=562976 RepID=A0ABP9YGA3_9FUNG